jgi:hypothetical protein
VADDSTPKRILTGDPDARSLRWGWTLFAAWTLLGGTLTLREVQAGEYALIGVVLLAPFWAAWLLWLGWRGWMRLSPWFGYAPHYRFHGNYYEFDGRQIRIWFDVADLWIAVDDVLDALQVQGVARDVERLRSLAGADAVQRVEGLRPWVFTADGLRRWLGRRGGEGAHRLDRWLEAEVLAPFRRRRELDAQAQRVDSEDG